MLVQKLRMWVFVPRGASLIRRRMECNLINNHTCWYLYTQVVKLMHTRKLILSTTCSQTQWPYLCVSVIFHSQTYRLWEKKGVSSVSLTFISPAGEVSLVSPSGCWNAVWWRWMRCVLWAAGGENKLSWLYVWCILWHVVRKPVRPLRRCVPWQHAGRSVLWIIAVTPLELL